MNALPNGVVAALTLLVCSPANADPAWPEHLDVDFSYRHSAAMEPGQNWDFRLGAGLEREPSFQGSDRYDVEPDVFLVAAYRAQWGNLFFTGNGIGYSKLITPSFGLQFQLEAEDTREESDDARMVGLGDQDQELELEVLGRYLLGPWQAGASVAFATGDKGLVWFLGGSHTWRIANDRLFLTLAADISGSSADNQRTDFGITPAQAAASVNGYPEYAPSGGLKSVGLGIGADYRLGKRWNVYAQVEFERLLGDIADSPLVSLGGSENNSEVGLGVYYKF